jgi:signal peptide peptidase SppA
MSGVLNVMNSPWAITREKYEEITAIYTRHLLGEKIELKDVEARLGRPLNNQPKGYEVRDGVAVLPMVGVISKRMGLFTDISGGVSTQMLEKELAAAIDDPKAHSVVLHIDSPGGTVDGTQAVANAVRAARSKKPVVAVVDGMMCSGACWIGTGADRVFITNDTDVVGSIGVVTQHIDYSRAEEQRGVKVTEITAGKYKRIASEHAPLSEEGRATIQERVDHIYSVFVDAVAQNRRTDSETVLNKMADGKMFHGKQAIEAGLVDGVSTLSDVIAMLNAEHQAVSSRPGAVSPKTTQKGTNMDKVIILGVDCMTQEQIDAAVKAAQEAARAEGKKEATTEAVTAERARIKGIEEAALPGHEELVQTMKYDGTSVADAAVKILAAEKQKSADKLAAMKKNAPKAADHATAPKDENPDDKKPKQTVAEAQAIGKKAQAYIAEQAAKGIKVSASEAVKHVQAQ